MHDCKNELKEWRQLVGATILSFGDIELITLKCLSRLPSDRIFESTSKLPFATRIDLIIEIIEGKRKKLKSAEVIVEKLKRAKKLVEYRNVLAHNPLVVDIYKNKTTGDIAVEHLIYAERKKKKRIDIKRLKELSLEVEDIASELYTAFSRYVSIIDKNNL